MIIMESRRILHHKSMKHSIHGLAFSAILSAILILPAKAQTTYGSEAELKKEASRFFEKEDYVAAAPLFTQLLSLYPKDPLYNYRCGICLLYVDPDKNKAVSYLSKAASMTGRPADVYFYLGKAYHQNYQFDEAIASFREFQKSVKKDEADRLQADRQIEMCNNAKQFMGAKQFVEITEKQEVPSDAYHTAYDLYKYNGKVLATPDIYRTSQDKKRDANKTLYLSGGVVYYSSLGDDGKSMRDIYRVLKFSQDKWVKPQNLGPPVNTASDEEYPSVTPDGTTLYFSSKGHNSMGGYDIFKSVWDAAAMKWSEPENMGVPINSPFDDYFLVAGSDDGEAYFTSGRESAYGKVQVFKIRLLERPMEYSLVKGKLFSGDTPVNTESRISVFAMDNNKLVGLFKTDPQSGNYVLTLPPSSTYKFVVESDGYLPHSENITIPPQYKITAMRQEILLSKSADGEDMIVKNYFNQSVSDSAVTAAGGGEQVQEVRSTFKYEGGYKDKLVALNVDGRTVYVTPAVNLVKGDMIAQAAGAVTPPAPAAQGTAAEEAASVQPQAVAEQPLKSREKVSSDISNKDIVQSAFDEAVLLREEAKKLSGETKAAYEAAVRIESLSKAKEQQAQEILASLPGIKNEKERQDQLEVANKLKAEAEVAVKEAELGYMKAKEIGQEAAIKQKEADFAMANAGDLEKSSGMAPASALAAEEPPTQPLKTAALYAEESRKAKEVSENLRAESVELARQAAAVKEEAKAAASPSEKENILLRAYNLEALARKRIEEADMAYNHARQLEDSVRMVSSSGLASGAESKSVAVNPGRTTQTPAAEQENITGSVPASALPAAQTVTYTAKDTSVLLADAARLESEAEHLEEEAVKAAGSASQVVYAEEKKAVAATALNLKNQAAEKRKEAGEKQEYVKLLEKKESISVQVAPPQENQKVYSRQQQAASAKEEAQVLQHQADSLEQKAQQLFAAVPYEKNSDAAAKKKEEAGLLLALSSEKQDAADKKEAQAREYSSALQEQPAPAQAEVPATAKPGQSSGTVYRTPPPEESEAPQPAAPAQQQPVDAVVLRREADNLESRAEELRKEASSLKNKKQAARKMQEADSLSALSVSKRLEDELKASAAESSGTPAGTTSAAQEPGAGDHSGGGQQQAAAARPSGKAKSTASESEHEAADVKLAIAGENQSGSGTAGQTVSSAESSPAPVTVSPSSASSAGSSPLSEEAAHLSGEAKVLEAKASDLRKEASSAKNKREAARKNTEADSLSALSVMMQQEAEAKLALAGENQSGSGTAGQTVSSAEPSPSPSPATVSSSSASSSGSPQLSEEAAHLSGEAKVLEAKASDLRKEASSAKNKREAARKNTEADSLSALSVMMQQEADAKLAFAGGNPQQGEPGGQTASASVSVSPEAAMQADSIMAEGKRLEQESESLARQSQEMFKGARRMSNPAEKDRAMKKASELNSKSIAAQQQSVEKITYAQQIKEGTAATAPAVSASAAGAEAPRTDEAVPVKTVSSQPVASQPSAPVRKTVRKKPQPEEVIIDPLKIDVTTPEYAQYVELKTEIMNEQESLDSTRAAADALDKEAKSYRAQVESYNATAQTAKSKQEKTQALDNVKMLESQAAVKQAGSDQLAAQAEQSEKELEAKRKDLSEQYNSLLKSSPAVEPPAVAVKDERVKENITPAAEAPAREQDREKQPAPSAGAIASREDVKAENASAADASVSGAVPASGLSPGDQQPSAAGINAEPVIALAAPAGGRKTPLAEGDVIKIVPNSTVSVYSAVSPIPLNPPLPPGLIFKIQIGAFRNPIPQDLFKGMQPLAGETSPNGLIRYTAGIFHAFDPADWAKNEVRQIGYKDAFVVAYYNGKRISIAEAKQFARNAPGQPAPAPQNIPPLPVVASNAESAGERTRVQAEPSPSPVPETPASEEQPVARRVAPPAASHNPLDIGGLVFRVQIGAFREKVPHDIVQKFLAIRRSGAIVNHPNAEGLNVFYAGVLKDFSVADALKNQAVEAGIADAFIVAFKDGKQISLEEAKSLSGGE